MDTWGWIEMALVVWGLVLLIGLPEEYQRDTAAAKDELSRLQVLIDQREKILCHIQQSE